jgi:phosphoenolpyruvate carboxykinase (ATP)
MSTETFPLSAPKAVHHNVLEARLVEIAVAREEGRLASTGAFVAETGVHTGRSPQDKFVIRDADTEKEMWWDNNKSITRAQFDVLYKDFMTHVKTREMFVQDLHACAEPGHQLKTRVFTEYAWHSLFIRNMLRSRRTPHAMACVRKRSSHAISPTSSC